MNELLQTKTSLKTPLLELRQICFGFLTVAWRSETFLKRRLVSGSKQFEMRSMYMEEMRQLGQVYGTFCCC